MSRSILAFILPVFSKFEYFSSIDHLNSLNYLEQNLIIELKNYLEDEKIRLAELQNFVDDQQVASDLSHPVNQYRLIKRTVDSWPKVIKNVQSNIDTLDLRTGPRQIFDQQALNLENLPDESDKIGATDALLRLQKLYFPHDPLAFETELKAQISLTVDDFYEVGMHALDNNDIITALYWFRAAYHKNVLERQEDFDMINLMDHIAYLFSQILHFRTAIDFSQSAIRLALDDTGKEDTIARLNKNIEIYAGYLSKDIMQVEDEFELEGEIRVPDHLIPLKNDWEDDYSRLCREKNTKYAIGSEDKGLVCYYLDRKNPRLILKPAKVEQINKNPEIVIFHDAISHLEAKKLKDIALPKLYRATINNYETGAVEYAKYRVSKNSWLTEYEWDDNEKLVRKLNQRIGDYTGLSMDTAEELQVNNYGPGGQYEPHWDHSKRGDFQKNGNRIATFMFYLSDVEQGGNTAYLGYSSSLEKY